MGVWERANAPPAHPVGVAALDVTQASATQFSSGKANLEIAGQADVAVGEGEVDDDQVTQRVIGVLVRADGVGLIPTIWGYTATYSPTRCTRIRRGVTRSSQQAK